MSGGACFVRFPQIRYIQRFKMGGLSGYLTALPMIRCELAESVRPNIAGARVRLADR